MIGAYVQKFNDYFPEEEIAVPIEGSIFWKIPIYKELVDKYALKASGNRHFKFAHIEHAGIIGAAAAALNQLTRQVPVFEG